MPTVNATLRDKSVGHAVDLHRFSNGVQRRMVATLNRADASLSAQLAEALARVDPLTFTVERLESLLTSVRTLNQQAYRQVQNALEPELKSLAAYETGYQARTLTATLPVNLAVNTVAADQVYAAALSRPFQGRLLAGWMANLAESRAAQVRNAVRVGFVEGKTATEIVRTLSGTKALGYADGLFDKSRRELMTVVNTALSHTAQTARQQFYRANEDIVKAVQWVSTLDTRTSEECAIRDGLEYTAEGEPIGHSIPWLGGPGRLHFNCRSVDVPVTKSWRELGLDLDDTSAGTRASMDGEVPENQNYAEWLGNQSASRQDDVLGATRGELFRQGVPMEKFYNDKGVFLTLDELYKREGLTPP